MVQNPDFFGHLHDHSALAEACRKAGALLIVAVTEPVSLGLVESPGAMGADIVTGEGQPIGNSLGFGGPYLGLFASREKYVRQMPGRLVGETADVEGKRGWVLTLSTREQHIRREKATSNICTNSGLCTLAFTIHLTLLGEAGFTRLAALNHATAVEPGRAAGEDRRLQGDERELLQRVHAATAEARGGGGRTRWPSGGILAGVPVSRLHPKRPELANLLLVAASECTTERRHGRARGRAERGAALNANPETHHG